MARILAVGIATLDIINEVARFPPEDSEVRALAQRQTRGGNATNTLVVLSQLGHDCSWAGVLADDPATLPILADLEQYGIDLRYCQRMPGKQPTSYILLSRHNGSRSIVHYRDLPEFSEQAFSAVPLDAFDWLHFEGRNCLATSHMLATARRKAPQLPCSVELEKPRPDSEKLYGQAQLLMFSRPFAEAEGYHTATAFLTAMQARVPHADLVCSWGAEGAYALDRDGLLHRQTAFVPPRVIDTLGAGDTFNAGLIDARVRGQDMASALQAACRLAGRKCGQLGLGGLGAGHG